MCTTKTKGVLLLIVIMSMSLIFIYYNLYKNICRASAPIEVFFPGARARRRRRALAARHNTERRGEKRVYKNTPSISEEDQQIPKIFTLYGLVKLLLYYSILRTSVLGTLFLK
jgi:hypothetical protein